MTGLTGGTLTGDSLDAAVEAVRREDWYGEERFEDGVFGLGLLHHGDRDPGGHAAWADGRRAGVVYGAPIRPPGTGRGEFVESVLDEPAAALADADGPFAVAAYDAADDRVVVATDKLGSRPVYYAADDGRLAFGSELDAVAAVTDDHELDLRAAGDLVAFGYVWGEKTVLDGVRALPPATVLERDADGTRVHRYWLPDFREAPADDRFAARTVARYREAVADMVSTMPSDAGIWLSGGLDSRSLGAELRYHRDAGDLDSVTAYTYDSNPPGGGNPAVARRVADRLGVEIRQLDTVTPSWFLDVVERGVDRTGGMVHWRDFINLASVFSLPESRPGVVLEASAQGEFLGENVWRPYLTGTDPVESLYGARGRVEPELVRDLFRGRIDPFDTLRNAVERSDESTARGVVLDAHYRNSYSRDHMVTNQMARSRVGTRTPFAHGAFLDHVHGLPREFALGTLPLTGGAVPEGVAPLKLTLLRRLDERLADVVYDRTRLPPSSPHLAHTAGFLAKEAASRVRAKVGGGRSVPSGWYRENPDVRSFVNGLVDDACDRGLVDPDVLRDLQDAHLDGTANNLDPLSPVTTLELWLQRHLD